MGLFFRSPNLQKHERIRWRRAANHEQAGVARGGRLFLTSRRLVFTANRFEARLGAQDEGSDELFVVTCDAGEAAQALRQLVHAQSAER